MKFKITHHIHPCVTESMYVIPLAIIGLRYYVGSVAQGHPLSTGRYILRAAQKCCQLLMY